MVISILIIKIITLSVRSRFGVSRYVCVMGGGGGQIRQIRIKGTILELTNRPTFGIPCSKNGANIDWLYIRNTLIL